MTISLLPTGVKVTAEDVRAALDRAECEEFEGDVRVLFTRAGNDRIVLATEIKRLRAKREQVGWYCPTNKRLCYLDERPYWRDGVHHVVPVFVEAAGGE